MIPFSPPHIDDKIVEEVVAALRSGWITTGPRTKNFEKKLAEYCGVSRVLCVNSASAGLELVLRWFGVGPGDEVIVPAYTYTATAEVVAHCGATPVMVDVHPDFLIDPERVREAITPKTKVIVPVDIAGYPCDYDELFSIVEQPSVRAQFCPANELQKRLGRPLIMADAAHSLGGWYKGRRVLTSRSSPSTPSRTSLPPRAGPSACTCPPRSMRKKSISYSVPILCTGSRRMPSPRPRLATGVTM